MPGGDGTGPGGMGPMTGRAAGYCAGYGIPGYMNPVGGRGFGAFGRGRGGGWGWRNMFYATGLAGWQRANMGMGVYPAGPAGAMPYATPFGAPMTKEQELDMLKRQAGEFENGLEGIKKRIGELEAEDS
ncbi:MAG: DUF5320 domain-containing protein [Planctomycetes bacterium]|nr:DUF5320 domain-containing protein [Planctomycetota bacterium]